MAECVVCALCALIILKPQEFLPALAGVPVVYIVFGAALLCIAVGIVLRSLRPRLAPSTPFILGFFAWALLTTLVKKHGAFVEELTAFAILSGVYLSVSVGLSSGFGLRAFMVMFVACGALVTDVAVEQNNGPYGCFVGAADDWEGRGEMVYDGRPCETAIDCRKDALTPTANYRCEKVGPLATSSIEGRVRYRGSLADPNELSLMISLAIPFTLALIEVFREQRKKRRAAWGDAIPDPRGPKPPAPDVPGAPDATEKGEDASPPLVVRKTSLLRSIPAAGLLAAIGFAVILARSRSGLIVFLLVIGISFIRKVGAWGLVAGCFVAPPMLLLGGRSGSEAEDSADERAQLLREGFAFIRKTRGIGLGTHQFTQESSIGLTAHNAYLLAAAETGVIGFLLFGFAVYLSLKIPYALWFGGYRLKPATVSFATAQALALTGATVGIFFLSWTYKDILYMLFGASAALYGVARSEDPKVRLGLSPFEGLRVTAGLLGLLVAIYLAARFHR
jgi:hypothetical protein